MKKSFVTVLLITLCFLTVACGGSSSGGSQSDDTVDTDDTEENDTNESTTKTYTLTLTTNGNGSITANPLKEKYTEGETVTLTAIPNSGNAFSCWSGDASGYGDTTTIITMNSNKSVTSEFITGGIYYVNNGSNGNGSFENPWGSVQTAINSVTAPAAIYIAAGTYNESISVKEGVSLYGGFSTDFSDRKYMSESERSNSSYKTLLTSTTSGSAGGESDPQTSFLCDGSSTVITNETVVEGFTITGGPSDYDSVVICENGASPTICYNTITGIENSLDPQKLSCGLFVYNSLPIISYNTITGNIKGASAAYGVYCHTTPGGSTMKIDHNSICGGNYTSNSGEAIGIKIQNSSATAIEIIIEYNTITGGDNGANSTCGVFDNSTDSIIRFNRIAAGSAYTNFGSVSTIGISTLEGNLIYNNIISGGISDSTYTGTSNSSTTGVGVSGDAEVYNNTIFAGEATSDGTNESRSVAVYTGGPNAGNVKNNILFASQNVDVDLRIGVLSVSGIIGGLYNNNIFDTDLLYRRYDGSSNQDYTTTSGYETYLNGISPNIASGNITIDLIDNNGSYYLSDWDGADNNIFTISDNNWHLTSDVPLNVRGGGVDLSSFFTKDYDGNTRTTSTPSGMTNTDAAGWSIGAYERD